MKALTVKQPWAWAIIHGGKNIENRTTAWNYRGPLAIHAGAGWSQRGAEDRRVIEAAWDRSFYRPHVGAVSTNCPPSSVVSVGRWNPVYVRNAIIGVVELVDAHPEHGGCCQPWGESSYVQGDGVRRGDVCHLVLENPRAIEPIDFGGRLGLWNVADGLVATR